MYNFISNWYFLISLDDFAILNKISIITSAPGIVHFQIKMYCKHKIQYTKTPNLRMDPIKPDCVCVTVCIL